MHKKRKKRKLLISVSIVLSGIIFLFIMTNQLGKEIIINNIETTAANTFLDITNSAVGKVLNKYDIEYSDLSTIQKDNSGNIIAVTCDTLKLMQIKSFIDEEIQNCIKENPTIKFSIALGSFLGNEYFAGRGPKIPFEFSYDCATITEFESQFYDAGINQTIHRIVLHIKADIAAVIPWDYKKSLVDTTYILAETVIVGKVPSSFTNIDLVNN